MTTDSSIDNLLNSDDHTTGYRNPCRRLGTKSKFFLAFICVCLCLYIIPQYYQPFDGWTFSKLSNRYQTSTLMTEMKVPNCAYSILDFNRTGIIVISLEDFLSPAKYKSCQSDDRELSMALVVPTKMYADFRRMLSLEGLLNLAIVLRSYDWMTAVSGAPLVLNPGELPVCTMAQSNFTLVMSTNYSTFENGLHTLSVNQDNTKGELNRYLTADQSCYACDLLPDVFLIKFESINNISALGGMHESARMALFLNMIGRSAYCPDAQLIKVKGEIQSFKLTCNQLRTVWDGHFLTLPRELGVYRLILRDQASDPPSEYWLGCTWSKLAWDSHSPLHCANWIRQYISDVVEILERKMNIEYRIIYGSLLGAVRDGDVIPWSVDADLSVENSGKDEFKNKIWSRVPEISEWRYSNLARDGLEHYAPMRAMPICPIKLTTFMNDTSIFDLNRTIEIGRMIKDSLATGALLSSDDHWRSTGYVDLYETSKFLEACTKKLYNRNKWDYVNIGNRRYKTVHQQVENLKCIYGDTWNKPPKGLSKDWNHYSDAVKR